MLSTRSAATIIGLDSAIMIVELDPSHVAQAELAEAVTYSSVHRT